MPVLNHLNVRHARTEGMQQQLHRSVCRPWLIETEGRRLDLGPPVLTEQMPLLKYPESWIFMVAELEEADDRQLLGQLMITYEWRHWAQRRILVDSECVCRSRLASPGRLSPDA